ncbi:MAG: glutamate formimidoyltransferase [Anaerolineales bacterium]|nr:glutamate formimidoyltransferase [Anaerolineales bacterium]
MSSQLIECVPNFSEARRPEVIEAIQQAIAHVPDVYVLDRHMDTDHNRTVITFVGSPTAVEQAAFQAIAKAAELIDLDQHQGEHPRIGATDVVPFIPLSGVSMADCVALAKRLGQRVASELEIPVYLYEEAAASEARRNLEKHRKGQYEALKHAIENDPERAPDFGPRKLGKAGATVIGAREFLVAYNVYLTSPDVEIAKKIASTIRHSSGGLRYVKALGLLVEGRSQVSMNLTNFRKTPLALVVETIRREAQRYGVGIHHSELVGLIPQEALVDTAVWYTQLDQFDPDQILEKKLYAALQSEAASEQQDFLSALADSAPTPGGGSAAAYAGAMAAALAGMVARVTIDKPKYEPVRKVMQALQAEADLLREALRSAVIADAAAFEAVMQAYRLPKENDVQKQARQQAIEQATLEAARVPLETAQKSLQAMQLAVQAARLGNTNAISDAASGAALAQAALAGSALNVRINLSGLPAEQGQALLEKLEALEGQAQVLKAELDQALVERANF